MARAPIVPFLLLALCSAALSWAWPAAAQSPAVPAPAGERVLNVYNWADYVDPAALEQFRRETGVRVRYDVYDSLETLEAKLSAGRSGYDVVVPTAEPSFARLVRAGALRRLDRARIPNLGGQDPELLRRVAASDPGNAHGAIYLWGTIGLAVRPSRIRALAPDAPLDSLDLLLRPEHVRRIARCGVVVMDSGIDVIPSVMRWLGRDPDASAPEDLRAAEGALLAARPHWRAVISSAAILEALAAGEHCAAFTYSGDAVQARARAAAACRGDDLVFVPPRDGAQLWFDMLAIPADAPNPDDAHAFIDFLLRPEVIAGVSNAVRYPNAVPASRAGLSEEVLRDPNVYPAPEVIARSFAVASPPAAVERARSRLWARVRAGR